MNTDEMKEVDELLKSAKRINDSTWGKDGRRSRMLAVSKLRTAAEEIRTRTALGEFDVLRAHPAHPFFGGYGGGYSRGKGDGIEEKLADDLDGIAVLIDRLLDGGAQGEALLLRGIRLLKGMHSVHEAEEKHGRERVAPDAVYYLMGIANGCAYEPFNVSHFGPSCNACGKRADGLGSKRTSTGILLCGVCVKSVAASRRETRRVDSELKKKTSGPARKARKAPKAKARKGARR